MGAPLSIDAETATKALLASMDVVAGGAYVIALRRPATRDDRLSPATATAVTP